MLGFFKKTVIVTGHYGSGKTNLSINLALDLARQGKRIALVDMDIVNPYFRSADFRSLADKNGIDLVASPYANSNIELPTLNFGLERYLDGDDMLILDVGGDDTGAIALGQYAHRISQRPYTMLCVVNRFRSIGREPAEDAELLNYIQASSRLQVTHICNNSNLGPLTTKDDIERSIPWAEDVARMADRPLAFTSVRRDIAVSLGSRPDIYPVDVLVKTLWQTVDGT